MTLYADACSVRLINSPEMGLQFQMRHGQSMAEIRSDATACLLFTAWAESILQLFCIAYNNSSIVVSGMHGSYQAKCLG